MEAVNILHVCAVIFVGLCVIIQSLSIFIVKNIKRNIDNLTKEMRKVNIAQWDHINKTEQRLSHLTGRFKEQNRGGKI